MVSGLGEGTAGDETQILRESFIHRSIDKCFLATHNAGDEIDEEKEYSYRYTESSENHVIKL